MGSGQILIWSWYIPKMSFQAIPEMSSQTNLVKSRDFAVVKWFLSGSQSGMRETRDRFPNVMIGIPEASTRNDLRIQLSGLINKVDKCFD